MTSPTQEGGGHCGVRHGEGTGWETDELAVALPGSCEANGDPILRPCWVRCAFASAILSKASWPARECSVTLGLDGCSACFDGWKICLCCCTGDEIGMPSWPAAATCGRSVTLATLCWGTCEAGLNTCLYCCPGEERGVGSCPGMTRSQECAADCWGTCVDGRIVCRYCCAGEDRGVARGLCGHGSGCKTLRAA